MPIEVIDEWRLSAADDGAIADLLARCFDTDFGGRSFFIQHHHLRLVLREEGQIVGHIAMVLRAVQLGDSLVTIAGLAEVATDPDHRGKGIAADLLQAAIVEARSSPAEFLLLFGQAKLYAAAGFRRVGNRMAQIITTGSRAGRVIRGDNDHLMILPLGDRPWPDAALLDLRGPVF
ncbi:MAG: GNAT family N-acetyltransferase [bacterium]